MYFRNTITFKRPAIEINEDDCAASLKLLIALDGATGLYKANYTPNPSDASWLATEGVETLMQKLGAAESVDISIPQVVYEAAKEIGQRFFDLASKTLSPGEMLNPETFPSAGLSLAWISENKIHVYSLGDLTVALMRKDGTTSVVRGKKLPELDSIVISKMARLAKERGEDVIAQRPLVQEDLRINRNLRNKDEGYFIFDPTAEGADKGIYEVFDAEDVERVLIVSDGISDAVGVYDIFSDYRDFAESVKKDGGASAYAKLRQIQADDPGCNKYPRFKIGDDVSIVYGEVAN